MNYSDYFNPEVETMSQDKLQALQLERLQKTVRHCMNSPFYQKKFQELGITPEDIKTLDDVQKLPFTSKEDLRENYPFGLACVPMKDCVRLHSSSGTTGNPTVVLHTQKDLDEWANAVARCLWMVGSRPEDVFQNSAGYGMFTAGLGFQYGAEKVGMLTVPAAAGNTIRQIKFIKDFGTTVLHAIPSYASRIYEVMKEEGVDPRKDTNLRVLCIGAEPHSEEQRQRIEQNLGVKAYNSYGISEMMGPGVAFECQEQNGLHIWEDYFIVEIIDPVTLKPVPDGQLGELVLTTINREAMPLLRYRTRDLTRILPGECPCGRHHRRLARLQGRSDDMMILKGVNIFPIQIDQRVGGVVGKAHDLGLLGTQLGYLHHQWEGVVLPCTVGTMDGGFVDFLAQLAVAKTGQQGLLCGVHDDDGVGCLASPALSILGTLGDIGLAETGQLLLLVDPHHCIVGGSRQYVAPLRLQVGDAQVDFLHTDHLVVRQQGTLAHEVLVDFLQELLVFTLQRVVVAVVDLPDAFEQRLVERDLVLQVCQHRLHLLLYLANLVGFVGLDNGEEHTAYAVECLAALLEGKDGILEGCRVLVLHDLGDFIAFLLDGSLEGGQIVSGLYHAEIRRTKRQGALLQQRVLTLGFRAACQLHHRC